MSLGVTQRELSHENTNVSHSRKVFRQKKYEMRKWDKWGPAQNLMLVRRGG
jgi:hypothetical protein